MVYYEYSILNYKGILTSLKDARFLEYDGATEVLEIVSILKAGYPRIVYAIFFNSVVEIIINHYYKNGNKNE